MIGIGTSTYWSLQPLLKCAVVLFVVIWAVKTKQMPFIFLTKTGQKGI